MSKSTSTAAKGTAFWVVAGATLGVALFCYLHFGWANRPDPEPKLLLPPHALYLGKGGLGEVVDGSFRLRNIGDAPLDFQIEAHCGCSGVTPTRGRIPAGEVQEVKIGVRLQSQGERRSVSLTITSNDAERPSAGYVVYADCPAPAVAVPSRVDFGRIGPGQIRETEVVVTLLEDASVVTPEAITLKTSGDRFRCSLDGSGVDPRRLTLHVASRGDLPHGVSSDVAVVEGAQGRRLVEIPLAVEVVRPIIVAPEVVFLRGGDPGAVELPTVVVRRADGRPIGRLLRAEAPEGFSVEDGLPEKAEYHLRPLKLRASPSCVPGEPFAIGLHMEGVDEPVQVRVVPPAI